MGFRHYICALERDLVTYCQIGGANIMSLEQPEQQVLSEKEFVSALAMLHQIFPNEELDRLQPSGSATVYTSLVTLRMLIL
jgi:hypothetical protein